MGYQFVGDSAIKLMTGHFTGRCPLTGRFMSGTEFGDDEPVEHHFGLVYDPTEIEVEDDGDDDSPLWFADEESGAALLPNENEEQWVVEEATAYWVENTFRRRFPHLWDDVKVERVKTFTPAQNGRSGFGTGGKARVDLYDFDWVWARRGIGDQGKKCRKARLKRTLRKVRARVRNEYDMSLPHERKVEVCVDRGYWSLWDDFFLAEPDVVIDTSFGWPTDYVRLTHTTMDQTLLAEWAEYNSPIWDVYQVVVDEEDMLEALLDQSIDHYAHHLAYEDSFGDDYGFYPDDSSCDDDYDEFEAAKRAEDAYWNNMSVPSDEELEEMDVAREAEAERLLETLSISHSGGGRGTKAVKAARALRLRPHDCFEAV